MGKNIFGTGDAIREIEKKEVKDRTKHDHLYIIKHKFNGDVRDYLLSMGDFKEPRQIIVTNHNKDDVITHSWFDEECNIWRVDVGLLKDKETSQNIGEQMEDKK